MARFQIPDFLLDGFDTLRAMNEEQVQALVDFVVELPLGVSVQDLEEELYRKEILSDRNPSFAVLIYSLGNLLLDNEEGPDQISEELSFDFFASQGTNASDSDRTILKERLVTILARADRLKKIVKINRILGEAPLSYQGSRVLTDIRLIFEEEMDAEHRSGLILHQLKIDYLENRKSKSLFFTLTRKDLLELSEVVRRALEKEKIITEQYKKTEFIELK